MSENSSRTFRAIRHGCARSNENRIDFQGAAHKALDRDGSLIDNPLAPRGELQAQAGGLALKAEGICLTRITSSAMRRAVQTAEIVSKSYGDGVELLGPLPNLEELFHGDWEPGVRRRRLTRSKAAQLTDVKTRHLTERLYSAGVHPTLFAYAGWLVERGDRGETPLHAAVRCLGSITTHLITQPHTLTVVHGMATRYAVEIGEHLNTADRAALPHSQPSRIDELAAILECLHEKGVPPFTTANSKNNKFQNGEYLEAEITDDGRFVASRRILPVFPSNEAPSAQNVTTLHQRRSNGAWEPSGS